MNQMINYHKFILFGKQEKVTKKNEEMNKQYDIVLL